MSRVIPIVLAVLASSASIVSAAEPKPDANSRTAPAARAKTNESAAAKKASSRKTSKPAEKTTGATPEARVVARNTKSVFIYAVDACTRDPKGCDQELRDDAERRFLDSCGVCNTAQRCAAERDSIVAGNARASQDPCAP